MLMCLCGSALQVIKYSILEATKQIFVQWNNFDCCKKVIITNLLPSVNSLANISDYSASPYIYARRYIHRYRDTTMKVQKVYLLQQSQILGNPIQCLLRHSQAYKNCKRHTLAEIENVEYTQ